MPSISHELDYPSFASPLIYTYNNHNGGSTVLQLQELRHLRPRELCLQPGGARGRQDRAFRPRSVHTPHPSSSDLNLIETGALTDTQGFQKVDGTRKQHHRRLPRIWRAKSTRRSGTSTSRSRRPAGKGSRRSIASRPTTPKPAATPCPR